MEDVHHVSIYIARPPDQVYEYASDPQNLPRWAKGLARSAMTREGSGWIVDAPFGRVKVRFAERNEFGVMDHDIELESGEVVHNPMRVMRHGAGSEFVFTLFRQPGMSDQRLAEDRRTVERDLRTLKRLLETRSTP